MHLKQFFWQWPNGIVWKWTRPITVGSRKKKFHLFLRTMEPRTSSTILDVGVTGEQSGERAKNFLEEWYAHPDRITAVGIDGLSDFKKRYPKVKTVETDGRRLPFKDKQFDIVFSNAVIEHVGGRTAQQQFVAECLRVGQRVFLTTPARSFPIESHTLIPFAHWLPADLRNSIYYMLGRKNEGKPGALTLLTARSFRKLFPPSVNVKIIRQRWLGLTSVLVAVAETYDPAVKLRHHR